MAGTGSYFQTYLKRALANLEAADRERTLEMPLDGSPEQTTSASLVKHDRYRSNARLTRTPGPIASQASSGTSRPSNVVPGTPTRSARASQNPSVTATPKLQELRSLFGLTDKQQ